MHLFVIPAKAEIQHFQELFRIPALRFAAAGMTYLVAGNSGIPGTPYLIIDKSQSI